MRITPGTRRLFEDMLGCKWTLAVLDALGNGVTRPGLVRRSVPGLTTKVMQERFRKLERYGLITRRLLAEKPLHVEYGLTSKGRQLFRLIAGVQKFEQRWTG